MGLAADPIRDWWEPKKPEQEERLERWLKEARERKRISQAARERESQERG